MINEDIKKMLIRLGKAVKTARLGAGERQSDVTKTTGLSQNIVTNLERGSGSAVSSLLAILKHLDLFDDVVAVIETNTKAREHVKISNAQVAKELNIESLGSGVTEQELLATQGDIVKLSDALKDEELTLVLKAHPNNIYRINKTLVLELAKDPTSNIALYENTIQYKALSGSIRQRNVYYATTLQRASITNLNWSVGGLIRKPNTAVDAVINLCADLVEHGKNNAKSLLFMLRKEFSQFNIFVDSISFCEPGEEKQSYLRKGDREVRGERYKALFNKKLIEWLNEIKA